MVEEKVEERLWDSHATPIGQWCSREGGEERWIQWRRWIPTWGNWNRARMREEEKWRGDGMFLPLAELAVESARPERHRPSLVIGRQWRFWWRDISRPRAYPLHTLAFELARSVHHCASSPARGRGDLVATHSGVAGERPWRRVSIESASERGRGGEERWWGQEASRGSTTTKKDL